MNKNKIIFGILGAILVIILLLLALNLRSTEPTRTTVNNSDAFNVWILQDKSEDFDEFLRKFRESNPKYTNKTNINVETFSDYDSYFYSLVAAFSRWEWPDLFTLNNSEISVLEDNIIGIDPLLISPSEFRKMYKWVFSDDLISRTGDGLEFLKGIPVWYESLWVYYNRRYFRATDFESWTALGSAVSELSERNSGELVPLGLGKSDATVHAWDIFTQLLALGGDADLGSLSSQTIGQALQIYEWYADERGDNRYNGLLWSNPDKNNLDLFSTWDVAAVIWYPRTLESIDEKWYRNTFLLATPFPSFAWTDHRTLINYDYYVINKDSQDTWFAIDLLTYMMTDEGASQYLDIFTHYLPAKISLEDDRFEKKINENYNVVYKDFYDRDSLLVSFNTGIKQIYDKDILPILSDDTNSISRFNRLSSSVICKAGKALTLENLSQKCE